VVFVLCFLLFAPSVLRAWCRDNRPSSSNSSIAGSLQKALSNAFRHVPLVSEQQILNQHRADTFVRCVSLVPESVVPTWLFGRPTCEESPLCSFNRGVWNELDRIQHGSSLECPSDPNKVIGCDLAWATGLGKVVCFVMFCNVFTRSSHSSSWSLSYLFPHARSARCFARSGLELRPRLSQRF
jgi:hypothetical protein